MTKHTNSKPTAVSQSPVPVPSPATSEVQPASGQRNHTLWIVGAITLMGVTCIVCGSYLIMHNHESSGILLVSSGGTGTITGLFGLISMSRGSSAQPAPIATATATADGGGDGK